MSKKVCFNATSAQNMSFNIISHLVGCYDIEVDEVNSKTKN